jgi:hypothetical protein
MAFPIASLIWQVLFMMWKLVGSAAAVGIGCLIVSNFASAGLARAMTPVQRRLQVLMTRDCVPDDVPDDK